MTAAFGVPKTIKNNGEDLRIWSENEARSASEKLASARLMTVVGFGALVIAAGIGYANSGPTSPLYRVTVGSSDEYCGSMSFRDDGKTVVVTGADGTTHTAELTEVGSVESAEKC
ncbi:hypothetical protein [Nocardioides sp.]|uniref:hypothetical protein n=1 Tax=Nocardioides sp. TaxID=35761 RepID=UPI0035ADA472